MTFASPSTMDTPSATNDAALARAIAENVRTALDEDVGAGDITAALLPETSVVTARIITRGAGVLCGRPWVIEVCRQVDARIRCTWSADDGDELDAGQTLLSLAGPVRALLTAERTMLNFLQLLSGTATAVREYARLIAHTETKILDTRKTIPGLRLAQKYAVRCGGGQNHRLGLYDAILIKENHIAAAGSIKAAVAKARVSAPGKTVEVEVERLDQLPLALSAGADIVMLDNFDVADIRQAVQITGRRAKLEASGGITRANIVAIAETGVDYISVGEITKRVIPLDLSMRIV
jgi:nicotinate-nucleotide pyrophosphorylase (carboxylating)